MTFPPISEMSLDADREREVQGDARHSVVQLPPPPPTTPSDIGSPNDNRQNLKQLSVSENRAPKHHPEAVATDPANNNLRTETSSLRYESTLPASLETNQADSL